MPDFVDRYNIVALFRTNNARCIVTSQRKSLIIVISLCKYEHMEFSLGRIDMSTNVRHNQILPWNRYIYIGIYTGYYYFLRW